MLFFGREQGNRGKIFKGTREQVPPPERPSAMKGTLCIKLIYI